MVENSARAKARRNASGVGLPGIANTQEQRGERRSVWSRIVAGIAAIAVGIGLVSVAGTAAQAAVPGINISVLYKGAVVADDTVIPEGEQMMLRVQYDAAQQIAGKQIKFTLPKQVTVSGGLPKNEAVESAVQNADGTYTVTFKDPLPGDITEGAFAIQLVVGKVDGNTESPISWEIGDDSGGVKIIVEETVTPPENITDSYAKAVNTNLLDEYVVMGDAPEYAFVGLKPELADKKLTYTLTMQSADARTGYAIADALPQGLSYVADSFVAELTAAGETNAIGFAPTVTGNSFAGVVDVPAQSVLKITYDVQVTDLEQLESALREQFRDRKGVPGVYQLQLTNTATFGDEHERKTDVYLRGNIPGVGAGHYFGKSGNWNLRDVIADEQGKLTPAAPMTYTLSANLTPWDERNANFTLQQNAVISDTLIEQASWKTGDGFITIAGEGPLTALTEAAGFSGSAADFAAEKYVGQYAVVGQTLFVNVGKNKGTNVQIKVKAQLNTVAGLPGNDQTTVVGGTSYPWNNKAEFYFGDGNPVKKEHNAQVVVLPKDIEGGVNDTAAFTKTAGAEEVRVVPGESAKVPYRFSIDTAKPKVDPLTSRIVDQINTEIFDVTDLASIPVSGTYGGANLTREHFALSADKSGNVVIELSEAGKQVVAAQPKHQRWTIDVIFTTVPLTGKQTLEIYNRATLHSVDSDWDYWSEDESEATSFGDEAEMRKRVFDRETGKWTANLNAVVEDGAFVDDRFVYAIELIPRGSYGTDFPVNIFTREDVLPESVEFLGFVELDADGVPNLENTTDAETDMRGNVRSSYADGVVTIRQADGTNLDPTEGRIVTYFAVRATDASKPIVNTIAGSEAVITPVGDPSIDIEKWNDEGETPEYDASGALTNDGYEGDHDAAPGFPLTEGEEQKINFTVSNDGREDLIDVRVSDKLIDGVGEITNLVCTFPDDSTGTEWAGPFKIGTQFSCTGTLPGLALDESHSDRATVTAVGIHTGKQVEDSDDWHGATPMTSVPIDPEPGVDPGVKPGTGPTGGLALTGGSTPWVIAGIAALILAAGGALLARRRRSA
ncbi:hypothetical protein ICM05_10405 [Leucobacter sp. cx-42]|uniref:hypothetical protein n=1 Tax=unclassified Leucobacter TaxID=2621730 RepID=UPI00165E4B7A|nr:MULTISPECIES: hypothetical protein [unclassified Leucobacter]MBC9955042.1 hypothetical protein [Leucobacter sp. cx-42]